MASINKHIIVGHIGKDPVTRFMPNGDAVINFSVATTEYWKNKEGQRQEKTTWHRVVAYRKLAEILGEYAKTGRLIYVEGKVDHQSYTDKQGVDKVSIQIIAEVAQLLDKVQEQQRKQEPQDNNAAPASDDAFADFEDSIPF